MAMHYYKHSLTIRNNPGIAPYVAEILGFVAFAAFSPVLKITSKWNANIPQAKICPTTNTI
jgi:hypothetical protein